MIANARAFALRDSDGRSFGHHENITLRGRQDAVGNSSRQCASQLAVTVGAQYEQIRLQSVDHIVNNRGCGRAHQIELIA